MPNYNGPERRVGTQEARDAFDARMKEILAPILKNNQDLLDKIDQCEDEASRMQQEISRAHVELTKAQKKLDGFRANIRAASGLARLK